MTKHAASLITVTVIQYPSRNRRGPPQSETTSQPSEDSTAAGDHTALRAATSRCSYRARADNRVHAYTADLDPSVSDEWCARRSSESQGTPPTRTPGEWRGADIAAHIHSDARTSDTDRHRPPGVGFGPLLRC